MSVYCDHSLYRPKGCGYVLKCTHNDKTYWVHKTYPSLQGVKRMLLSRIYDEADIFYVYKYLKILLLLLLYRMMATTTGERILLH